MKKLFERADEIRKERHDDEEEKRKLRGQKLLKEATDYFHEQFSDLIPMLKAQGVKYEIKTTTNSHQEPYAIAYISYSFKIPNRLTPAILDTIINEVELIFVPDSNTDGDFACFIDSQTKETFTGEYIDDLVLHLAENLKR